MTLAQKLENWLESPFVHNAILAVILINAAILGLETSPTVVGATGNLLSILDEICLAIFIAELLAKLYALRLRYFRSGWNVFDFVIIASAVIPGAQGLNVLRALRILRVLRVISISPSLRRVVEGFVRALPGMGSVFLLMAIIFYIAAVMATRLFGADFPEYFGSMGASLFTLFQLMTLENWAGGIARPVQEVFPYAWLFFVPFLFVTTFAVMNLLIGLIVNSMQEAASETEVQAEKAERAELAQRFATIERQLAQLLAAQKGK